MRSGPLAWQAVRRLLKEESAELALAVWRCVGELSEGSGEGRSGPTRDTGYTHSTRLAAEANQAKPKKMFEEMIPEEYRKYSKVFSEQKSERLPDHKPTDHAIDLKPDAPKTLRSKVYPMPVNEQEALKEFVTDNLQKGYIQPSKSPMASPVFFIKKKDGKLRLI